MDPATPSTKPSPSTRRRQASLAPTQRSMRSVAPLPVASAQPLAQLTEIVELSAYDPRIEPPSTRRVSSYRKK